MTNLLHTEQLNFLTAIGYPLDEVESREGPLALLVDGFEIELRAMRGGLVLRLSLGKLGETDAARVAGYAAGRMLKEEAVVAYDPERGELILWQKVPAGTGASGAKLAFELFMTSCDWWKSAVGAETAKRTERRAEELMRIMP